MSIESTNMRKYDLSSRSEHQNVRLALKLVIFVVGIFLVTLWKFRPI